MKKLLFMALLPLAVYADPISASHEIINTQIEEIKPPRVGVSNRAIAKVKSPFLYLKTIKTKSGKTRTVIEAKKRIRLKPLKLESAINKNIKINGKWYKEGDRIREYTIIKVSGGEAHLKSKKKDLVLYLNNKNDKIQFNVN